MKRAYNMDQWRRDFAATFAAAVPMAAEETRARGPLLAASNDEPEPLSEFKQLDAQMQEREAFYREADRGYEQQKAAGFPDRYERALHEQMNRRPA